MTALCRYCEAPVRVQWPDADAPPGAQPTLREDGLPVHVRARLKELVRSGKREEALDLYCEARRVDRLEAVRVLAGVMAPLVFELLQRTPLNAAGLAAGAGVPVLLIAASAYNARQSFLLAAVFAFTAASLARFFFPRLLVTWVRAHGRELHARVLHRAVVHPDVGKGALLLLHVELDGPGGPERVEFPFAASPEAARRLQSGGGLLVRRGLGLVLPVGPDAGEAPGGQR